MIRRIFYFLFFIDEEPRISWSNIAFVAILIKVLYTSHVDWASLATMFLACLNLLHERQVNSKDVPDVRELSEKITQIEVKISPILDQVKQRL